MTLPAAAPQPDFLRKSKSPWRAMPGPGERVNLVPTSCRPTEERHMAALSGPTGVNVRSAGTIAGLVHGRVWADAPQGRRDRASGASRRLTRSLAHVPLSGRACFARMRQVLVGSGAADLVAGHLNTARIITALGATATNVVRPSVYIAARGWIGRVSSDNVLEQDPRACDRTHDRGGGGLRVWLSGGRHS